MYGAVVKFILIIPAALKAYAEAASKQIDPTSVGDDFTKPLRTIGSGEITHYANMPNVTDEPVIAAIRQMSQSPVFTGGAYHECYETSARAQFLAVIAANGLEEIPEEVVE